MTHPEEPGEFCSMPLAALVTAGGRLLQAMVRRAVADRGCKVIAGFTDSSYLFVTEAGGPLLVHPETGECGERPAAVLVQSLSYEQIEEIRQLFLPFKFDCEPSSPLKLEWQGVSALVVSDMSYCLYDRDELAVDPKGNTTGGCLPPVAGWDAHQWAVEAWSYIKDNWPRPSRRQKSRPWLDKPAVQVWSATTQNIHQHVSAIAPRMFSPFSTALASGGVIAGKQIRRVVVAPYDPDPGHWARLDWHDYETGEPMSRTLRLETIRHVLDSVPYRVPRDMAGDRGQPLDRDSLGPLYPRQVRDGRRYALTADAAEWHRSADPAEELAPKPPEGIFEIDGPDPEIARQEVERDELVRLCIRLCGISRIAKALGYTLKPVQRWAYGSRPLPRGRAALDKAIRKLLDGWNIQVKDLDALPGTVGERQWFCTVTLNVLIAHYGNENKAAEAMGWSRQRINEVRRRLLQFGFFDLPELAAVLSRLETAAGKILRASERKVRNAHSPASKILAAATLAHSGEPVVVPEANALEVPAREIASAVGEMVRWLVSTLRQILEMPGGALLLLLVMVQWREQHQGDHAEADASDTATASPPSTDLVLHSSATDLTILDRLRPAGIGPVPRRSTGHSPR